MAGMSVIVKKVTQIMSGIIFLYGVYIILHGHISPGGGFAGGAVLAGTFILLVLAFGSDILKLKREERESSIIESSGILLFLILALGGMMMAGSVFFRNFLPKGQLGQMISAGLIPLFNIAVGIEVAAALLTIFLALVIYKEEGES